MHLNLPCYMVRSFVSLSIQPSFWCLEVLVCILNLFDFVLNCLKWFLIHSVYWLLIHSFCMMWLLWLQLIYNNVWGLVFLCIFVFCYLLSFLRLFMSFFGILFVLFMLFIFTILFILVLCGVCLFLFFR